MGSDATSEIAAAHDLVSALRADGHTVGLDTDDVVEDFDEHVAQAREQLDVDDLGGFFVVAHRQGQTDYSTSVVLGDDVAWGIVQIEMLGAHFRMVLDALPLDTTELIDHMVDEAIAIDDVQDGGDDGG